MSTTSGEGADHSSKLTGTSSVCLPLTVASLPDRAQLHLGRSSSSGELSEKLDRIARSNASVLLLGESGTGKSSLARELHAGSSRSNAPFRVIDCASLPDSLIESHLFGHERGAFTGAISTHVGAFEAAGNGTVFLDEIGELPLSCQAKLLRALEERTFERVGSNIQRPLAARIVVATHRDLRSMVSSQAFRQDLYFRISVVSVVVPTLRERRADIAPLAQHLFARLRDVGAGRSVQGFSASALTALEGYHWPGNIRELRNVIEAALVLGDSELIEPHDLPAYIASGTSSPSEARCSLSEVVSLPSDLASLETRAIAAAMRATHGNRTRAAAMLGISRVTLYNKLNASGTPSSKSDVRETKNQ